MFTPRFAPRVVRRQSTELATPDKGTTSWWAEHPEAYGTIAAVLGVIALICLWVLWRDQRKLPILPWRKSTSDKVPTAQSDQSVRNTTYTTHTNASRASRYSHSRHSRGSNTYSRYSTYYPEQLPGTPPLAPTDWRDDDGKPSALLPERKRSISVYSNDSLVSGSPASGPIPLPAVAYPYRQRASYNPATSPPPAVSYPHPVPYPAPPRSSFHSDKRHSQHAQRASTDFTPAWTNPPALAVTPPPAAQAQLPAVAMPTPRPASASYSSLTVQPQPSKRLSASPHQRHASMTLPTVPSPLARVTSHHELEIDPIAAAGRKLTEGLDQPQSPRSPAQRSPRSPRFPNSPPLPTSPTSPSASRVSVDYPGSPGRTRSLSSLASRSGTFHTPPTSPPLFSPSPPLPPGAMAPGPPAGLSWHHLPGHVPGKDGAGAGGAGAADAFVPPQARRARREASIDLPRAPSTHAL